MTLTNLLAYYKLDTDSNDSSGNGVNGADTAITYSPAIINNGAVFGSTSNIICPSLPIAGATALTTSFWIKKTSAKTSVILSSYNPVVGGHQMANVMSSVNTIRFVISSDGSTDNFGETPAITTGVWYHIFSVFDGSQTGDANIIKIYINGVLQTLTFIGTMGNVIAPTNYNLWIASLVGNQAALYLDGMLDEVAIWKSVGTQQDALDLYANGGGLQYPLKKRGSFSQFF